MTFAGGLGVPVDSFGETSSCILLKTIPRSIGMVTLIMTALVDPVPRFRNTPPSLAVAFALALGFLSPVHAAEWWTAATNPPPSLAPVFGDGADSAWAVTAGQFAVTNDPVTGGAVLTASKDGLTLEGRTVFRGDQELRLRIRLRTELTTAPHALLYLAKGDTNSPAFYLHLAASKPTQTLHGYVYRVVNKQNLPLHDLPALTEKLEWSAPMLNHFTYHLRAYPAIQPGWPEDFRVRVEHDMASLPDLDRKWLEVRIELRKGQIRFWIDDHLIATKDDPAIKPEGTAEVRLAPGVQLASYRVHPLGAPEKDFVPIRLAGYANARELVGGKPVEWDALPPADQVVKVEGVPFVFGGVNAEGNDHIDVGRSLYRQGNMEGYYPSSDESWGGSSFRDPARIQLRVPNGRYDSLYLIAACDDDRDSVPVVTALFFRPSAGFAECFEGKVPLATAKRSEAKPLGTRLSNGSHVNLWLVKIPLDPGKLTSFSDLDIVEIELTKQVRQYRSYPDPFIYGWHQAGRPSAVHVYAATLGEVPVTFDWQPDKFGHVWQTPEVPGYSASITNRTAAAQTGKLTVITKSHDGTEETKQEKPVTVAATAATKVPFPVPVKLNGYHEITATLEIGGKTWTEQRSFVRLAPDTRTPRWTEGKGALFGYWSYHGAHYSPKAEHHVRLMTMAGARTSIGLPQGGSNALIQAHWTRAPAGAWEVSPQPWAKEDPYDPAKYEAYKKEVIEKFTKAREAIPEAFRPDHVYFYPEPHVSLRLTAGNYPEYWNGEPYVYTDEEKANLRMFMVTSKCAAEAIRSQWPNLKIHIPWGDPLFIVPLLRAGFPKNLIDGSGLDICGFERLPEQQLHQISVHRLYTLRKEFEKAGIPNPSLQACEGIFVPTEVGACSWREQMDIYHRWALISMAYGVKRFYSGWFAFDCGSYYGSEHYGGCGIQRRIPYCDPKPAYAAYATMTDKLNEADFDGWLQTGSLSTYCLRFKGPKGNVYALWTLRGKRPVTLSLAADGEVEVTDSMNNGKKLKSEGRKLTFTTDASVVYVTGGEVASVEVGEADHSDALPPKDAPVVADLGDGSWRYTNERDLLYENNNFDTFRYPGKFSTAIVRGGDRGDVLLSLLEKQDTVHELMPWYNTLVPRRPIQLAGAPSHLGLWVKGASDWGRFIYVLRDAKGERWISIGTKDQWNCDDVHSWSAFNFDGWRYVRFELPGHTGWDNFRKHGTTWWRSYNDGNADNIVDLPLSLERIIVEQRSHILYVNDVQPVASDTVMLGKLHVEYATPGDATDEVVRESRLRMPLPRGAADLPNPIVEMQKSGVGVPTEITKLEPPIERNDGTTVHVHFKPVAGAKNHFIWVSAHADGRGAVNMTPAGAKDGVLVRWLRPAVPFHFWVTYEDQKGQPSKPSRVASRTLVDEFKEK